MTEPLDNLASAIVKRRCARETVTQTKAALERGRELLATAETRCSEFDKIGAEIAQYRADKIKQWINGHGSKPTAEDPLPSELQFQFSEKRSAEEDLASTRQAVDQLSIDEGVARNALAQAEKEVELSAVRVLRLEGEQYARELIECEERTFALNQSLSALCRLWTLDESGRRQAFPAGDLVRQAFNRPDPYLTRRMDVVEREAKTFWERRLAALLEDSA